MTVTAYVSDLVNQNTHSLPHSRTLMIHADVIGSFVWAMVTLLVNRFLLHIRAAEASDSDSDVHQDNLNSTMPVTVAPPYCHTSHTCSSSLRSTKLEGQYDSDSDTSRSQPSQPRTFTQLYERFDPVPVDIEALEGCYVHWQKGSEEARALRRL